MKYPSRSEPTYLALMSVDEKIPSIDGGKLDKRRDYSLAGNGKEKIRGRKKVSERASSVETKDKRTR